jgi:AcrR family transcriptional regulator
VVKERPRTRNAAATRAAILEAAKARFAEKSYENVALREIARDAQIDVALIGRYFGSKDGLFAEVVRELMHPDSLTEGNRGTFGHRLAEALMHDEATDASLRTVFLIIRAATSPTALPILREISYAAFTRPFAAWLGGEDAELRAHFIASALFGASLSRIIDKPVSESPEVRAAYLRNLASWLQAWVDGRTPERFAEPS